MDVDLPGLHFGDTCGGDAKLVLPNVPTSIFPKSSLTYLGVGGSIAEKNLHLPRRDVEPVTGDVTP